MARKYDSSRRAEAARKTRETILDAAFRLHGEGITDFETLAEEANVSLATVRKYFPSREELFAGCTSWSLRYTALPDLERLTAIEGAEDRLRACVGEVHAFYDSIFGQTWTGYLNRGGSPVLASYARRRDELLDKMVDLILSIRSEEALCDPETRGVTRGFLSYLTYYAFIREGGLSAEQASARITEALIESLRAMALPGREEATDS